MNNSQLLFFSMLDKVSYLRPLWDIEKREYIPDLVDNFIGTSSHGKIIMAKFFLGVWRHDNKFNFDLFEAVPVLDEYHLKIITDWMAKPFWP